MVNTIAHFFKNAFIVIGVVISVFFISLYIMDAMFNESNGQRNKLLRYISKIFRAIGIIVTCYPEIFVAGLFFVLALGMFLCGVVSVDNYVFLFKVGLAAIVSILFFRIVYCSFPRLVQSVAKFISSSPLKRGAIRTTTLKHVRFIKENLSRALIANPELDLNDFSSRFARNSGLDEDSISYCKKEFDDKAYYAILGRSVCLLVLSELSYDKNIGTSSDIELILETFQKSFS